ncbi:MAG: tyrosine--tRNA ligase [Verrucomicrobiales bacterium]|nr:tyrosine--tRNA ligase [Verrucomicrobiales bacterium]
MNILEDLEWRGLLADCTDLPGLRSRLASGRVTLYCGFDPTADSLHVGHLVPLLALRRFQDAGHTPLAVAGGATGSVGDPSGKSAERSLLTKDQIAANVAAVIPQLARLLDFQATSNPAQVLDNAAWTDQVTFIEFLRDIGKHFTVNQMVAKESVRSRMEDREVGISFTEFSYMLLQAFDFYVLARDHGCELQIGGSDQWGNITMGLELIRKKLGRGAFGCTLPLITKSDGTKFGKTEGGAVWLDAKRTSPYRFYQFWVNTGDADVIKYLKFFTFLSREEIEALAADHAADPGRRVAHRALARTVTTLIHGEAATQEAIRASEILFTGGAIGGLSEATFNEVVGEVPTRSVTAEGFSGSGRPLVELFVESGLCPSKGQARKDLEGGGLYLNNERITESSRLVTNADFLFGRHLLLRKGRRNYVVLSVTPAG